MPTPELRARLARAGIAAAAEPPAIAFEGFAHGKLEGAGIGAARTFTACLGALGRGSCEGAFCGAALLVGLGLCTAATPVGSVVGAVVAPSAAEVRSAEAELQAVLGRNPLQESLRAEVLALAARHPRNWAQASGSAEPHLQVALTHVATEGDGIDPPLQLSMTARARVLQADVPDPLWEAEFVHRGEARRLAEWSAESGTPLLRALERGYRVLASEIFERSFLLYPFPDPAVHRSGIFGSAFGLSPPVTPSLLWPARVESGRPMLRWQAFPRAGDRAAAPEEMERVARVRYELRVARTGPSGARELIYSRSDLERPEHRLERSLAAQTVYFWSVRAHFEMDGRPQHTEWSGLDRERWFRFRTP